MAGGGRAGEPAAVIGMSGAAPRSRDLATFWRHLENGEDLVTRIPGDRWDWKAMSAENAGA